MEFVGFRVAGSVVQGFKVQGEGFVRARAPSRSPERTPAVEFSTQPPAAV